MKLFMKSSSFLIVLATSKVLLLKCHNANIFHDASKVKLTRSNSDNSNKNIALEDNDFEKSNPVSEYSGLYLVPSRPNTY